MKITVDKKQLSEVLANALNVTSKKSPLSITTSVLIEANDGMVRVSASNIEQTFQKDIEANVLESGKAALACKFFYDIVSQYPMEKITINEVENRIFKIQHNNGPEYMVVGSNPDDFPEINQENGIDIELDGTLFKDIVKKTCFIQGDDMRPHIRGVMFFDAEKCLRSFSTDGAMISRFEFVRSDIDLGSEKYIVPKVGLTSISVGDRVVLSFTESNLFVETESGSWGIRLLEGDFPDTNKLFNLEDPEISFNAHEIIDILKRAKPFYSKDYKGILISFSENQINVNASNPESGDYKETVNMDGIDCEMEIGVDARKLYSIINITSTDSIIEFHGVGKPIIVKDGVFIFAIMPMTI